MEIKNKYNIGETVYFIQYESLDCDKITGVIYRGYDLCDYILDNGSVYYSEMFLEKTPEKAVEVYIKNEKEKDIAALDKKYSDLEEEILAAWVNDKDIKI